MGQILLIVLTVVIAAYAMVAIAATHQRNLTAEPTAQTAAAIEGATALYDDFNEDGTLVFYPNNVGPVPYLFYQVQDGHTVAKALTFSGSPPADFSSWSGARVSVTGHRNNEHVVVSRIVYLSAP